ncbi:polyamine ABC transporter ATP-binding protein [Vitreoscilla massiliensis]|uniref:Spermidine/putrescine import ATP-binding protein PotA n=1 Tax=Vitreoscilla massiliensis TaxID=1689272 RepID=A0ABY4E356_9NEIS|nr:polyamine ABC transporter ATP-binding protein [Vitreoscilla massiliensis]UOO88743.1 polyamine ABC transporter ATP-binding protein [Vitreoscilla massiliensis]
MTATPTETTKTPYLQIQGLVKKYGDNYAVDNVDLNIERHEIFALLGSSGSGKSTLLRMLAGMERPSQGKILLDGLDVTYQAPYERPINMMFQSYALFPHMSVEQNIAFGLKQDKMVKGEIDTRVEEMLKLVQMTKFAKRKPHQLSGGQQQRIALARSLAKRPKLLLLDEPLGALDKKLRQQTQLELVNMLEQVGVTCIMVTHDQEEAMTMATRVAIMSDGKLRQVGTPREIYDFPNSRFTAEFIGETNIIAGEVIEDAADYCVIASKELSRPVRLGHGITGPEDQDIWVSLRPEDVNLSRNKPTADFNWEEGKVKEIAYLGSFAIFHVELTSGKIIKSTVASSRWYLADEEPPTWDETVYVSWRDNMPVPLTR